MSNFVRLMGHGLRGGAWANAPPTSTKVAILEKMEECQVGAGYKTAKKNKVPIIIIVTPVGFYTLNIKRID